MNPSKAQIVIDHLDSGKSISTESASYIFGIHRLASIMNHLRRQGYKFETEVVGCPQGGKGRKRTTTYKKLNSASGQPKLNNFIYKRWV